MFQITVIANDNQFESKVTRGSHRDVAEALNQHLVDHLPFKLELESGSILVLPAGAAQLATLVVDDFGDDPEEDNAQAE